MERKGKVERGIWSSNTDFPYLPRQLIASLSSRKNWLRPNVRAFPITRSKFAGQPIISHVY